jgi:dTDP-4-dehydrorhamnose 3,5-epimerase
LSTDWAQISISQNRCRGTLRGLHFQQAPYGETKLVRCPRGAIFDVVVDVRPESATYLEWLSFELSAENCRMLYLPPGLAHGFQTLAADSEVAYQMDQFYRPEAAAGLRWNDRALAVDWPIDNPILSERDQQWPDAPLAARHAW